MPRVTRRQHAQGASHGEHAGRRWEYLEVLVHVEAWSDSAGGGGTLPIATVGKAQMPATSPLLNQLGAEGWELTGVAGGHSPLIFRLFLKRRSRDGA